MPRPQKPLEDQLNAAQEELKKAEEKVLYCKERITELKHQIEDRDMRDAYALLKKNNITVEQLGELLQQNVSKKK